MQSPRLRRSLRLVVAIAAIWATVSAGVAGADTRSERDEVRRKQAEVAANIDTLKATDAQVTAALSALQANVASTTSALADARRAVEAAEAELARATAEVTAKEAEITELDAAVKDLAVESYIRPPASRSLLDTLSADTIGEAEIRQTLLDVQSSNQIDLLDQLERAREDLESARQAADRAATSAEDQRAGVETKLAEVTRAKDQQAALAAEVEGRLNRQLAESAALADLDASLSKQLAAEQAALAAQLARQRSSSSGGSTLALGNCTNSVMAGGFLVDRSIADNVAAMVAAAAADGIHLDGGGCRSSERQAELRRINGCPDVYSSPSSSCRVPTAIPGHSMHERGLALDIRANGSLIRSRSNAGYQWLAANAASYGLYNLPSEPWHWSVNGN